MKDKILDGKKTKNDQAVLLCERTNQCSKKDDL